MKPVLTFLALMITLLKLAPLSEAALLSEAAAF
jgi:hypothetical protein